MKQGFTLVEMLIVVGIIGLLASLIFFGLGEQRGVARDATRIADLRTVQQALELYYQVNQRYPNTATWSTLETILVGAGIGVRLLPSDPLNDTNFNYQYRVDTGGIPARQSYVIGVRLENEEHRALRDDVDGALYGMRCADPYFCISF